MFGIIYSLFMGCIYTIGGIKDDIDNKECKKKYYNDQTGTYIDNRGCTRDYKTDEPRIVTSQWNKEKKRYEKIILKNGTQIIRNITEEEDRYRNNNNIQIKENNELNIKPTPQWEINRKKMLQEMDEYKEQLKQKNQEELEMIRRVLKK